MSATTVSPIRVLLVEDSALIRSGIRTAITAHQSERPIEVVGEAETVAAAIAETDRLEPDVVLLDLRLPDGSGLTACREIRRHHTQTRVVILTSAIDEALVYDSVAAGAHGYLLKDIELSGLMEAITAAADGKPVFAAEATEQMLSLIRNRPGAPSPNLQGISSLSAQEYRVLALVANGLTNKEVGESLGLAENTVKHYLANVFEKMGVRRRSQAVAAFMHAARMGGTDPNGPVARPTEAGPPPPT